MLSLRSFVLATCMVVGVAAGASAEDWIFDNGPYTRSAKTGERVDQYQKIKDPQRVPNSEYFAPNGPHPFMPYLMESDYPGWEGGGYFGGYGYGFGYYHDAFDYPNWGGYPAFGPIGF